MTARDGANTIKNADGPRFLFVEQRERGRVLCAALYICFGVQTDHNDRDLKKSHADKNAHRRIRERGKKNGKGKRQKEDRYIAQKQQGDIFDVDDFRERDPLFRVY